MRTILFPLLLIFFIFHAKAQQPPVIDWQKCLGGSLAEAGIAVIQTFDKGYLTVGFTESIDGQVTGHNGAYDAWVAKLSPTGTLVWQKSLGGSLWDFATSVQQTSDSGYILACYSYSDDGDVDTNRGSFDMWIVKLSSTGNIQWGKSYGGSLNDVPLCVRQTNDGGYIVAGWTKSTDGDITANKGDEDVWILKLTSTGAISWQKTFGGSGEDHATAIQQTSDGGYIFSGYTNSTDGDITNSFGGDDFWVVKLDNLGNLIWQKTLGGSYKDANGDHGYSGAIQQTTDGGYILSGWTYSNDGDVTGNHGDYDAWIVKLSATGNIQWQKTLGGSKDDEANYVAQTHDGGYIVGCLSNSTDGQVSGNHGGYDFWVVKLDTAGVIQWQQSYGGPGNELLFGMTETADSNIVMVGYTNSTSGQVSGYHGGMQDFWVVKLQVPKIVGVNALSNPGITITPNPAHEEIHINGLGSSVLVTIYNSLGQAVLQSNTSDVVSLSGLPAGQYLVRVTNHNGQAVKMEHILKL
jgi:hypothetical protein